MRVRFFGVRGSIPTPGPSTVRYGGNSVCVEVRLDDDTRILLDAGTGIRDAGTAIKREGYHGKIHLLITHAHWDHIMGLPFFGPVYDKHATLVFHPMTDHARDRRCGWKATRPCTCWSPTSARVTLPASRWKCPGPTAAARRSRT